MTFEETLAVTMTAVAVYCITVSVTIWVCMFDPKDDIAARETLRTSFLYMVAGFLAIVLAGGLVFDSIVVAYNDLLNLLPH